MNRKTFYRYNPATEQYDRVFPSRGQRIWSVARQYVVGALIGLAVFLGGYFLFDFPREKELRAANESLKNELDMLGRRADVALGVMEEIAERDNNFYRVIMQADPLTAGARFAGLERQRYYEQLDSMSDPLLVKTVTDKLDRLDNMLYYQSKSFDFLKEQASHQADRLSHIPAIQPISDRHLHRMASGYGYRRDPIYGTTRFHAGMDFSSDTGTPVYATGDGTVIWDNWRTGYGNTVEIDHGYDYTTRYAHLSEILVKSGTKVKRGDLIGKVGNTGKSTGPHLHYEVRFRGQPQNPVNYYFMDLTPEEYDRMIREAENAGHLMD